MLTTHKEIAAILDGLFGAIAAVSLSAIQIRRIIKGDIPLFGHDVYEKWRQIKVDSFDITMAIIGTSSFILFLIFMMGSK
jgi:hypothetical protein